MRETACDSADCAATDCTETPNARITCTVISTKGAETNSPVISISRSEPAYGATINIALMNWLLTSLLAIAIVCVAGESLGLTADVEADGYSFSLEPTGTNAGFTLFFTTWDGTAAFPLADCDAVSCTVSNEVSPVSLGSQTFRTDYFAVDALGVFEYGGVTVTVSATDADGNSQLDELQRTLPGNFTFSGTAVPDFNAFGIFFNSSVSGSVQRSAGSRGGLYSGTFSNPTQTAAFSSTFGLSGAGSRLRGLRRPQRRPWTALYGPCPSDD